MKPKLSITLTDAPVVVRLKRLFARLDDREQLLREWIDLRHGDVPGHCLELESVRREKVELSRQITEAQHRDVPRLALA